MSPFTRVVQAAVAPDGAGAGVCAWAAAWIATTSVSGSRVRRAKSAMASLPWDRWSQGAVERAALYPPSAPRGARAGRLRGSAHERDRLDSVDPTPSAGLRPRGPAVAPRGAPRPARKVG